MIRLLGICGSLRAASSSKALLQALADSQSVGWSIATAGIGELPHYNADHDGGAPVAATIDAIRKADGVVFVTPEYNYSVPGVLKNAIDWASRPGFNSVFKGKPCLVISTSGGLLGGVRAQGHLKQSLNGMLAEVFPWVEVVVPQAPAKMTDGVFTDTATLEFAGKALDAFGAHIAARRS